MEIFNDFNEQKNLSVAMGLFDGMHKGHKKVIKNAVKYARKNNLKSSVITFRNSPKSLINNDKSVYIMTISEKINFLRNLGIDYMYLVDFTEDLSKMSGNDYLKMICEKFKPKMITIGYNHTFGYNNSGKSDLLKEKSKDYGYEYEIVKPVKVRKNIVSSSAIKDFLYTGNFKSAKDMLGYDFYIKGNVVLGNQIGRKIGFKTANLYYPNHIVNIPSGVYKTIVHVDGADYKGIANFGVKPTLGVNSNKLLEVHIVDFDENIYGQSIKVTFIDRIRDERKFNSLEELKQQIERDIECLE